MKTHQQKIERIIRILIPLLISVVAIWWISRTLDFSKTLEILKKITWHGMLIHGLIFLLGLVLRGAVIDIILGDYFSFMTSFHGMNAGYLLNNLLPLRLGEFGRAGLLKSHAKHNPSFLEVFAGILTERILDLIIAVIFFLIGFNFIAKETLFPLWMIWIALVALILFVVLATLGAKHQKTLIPNLLEKHKNRAFLSKKLIPWLDNLLDGFHFFLKPRKLTLALFLLVLSWLCAMLEVGLLQTELMTTYSWWWPIVVLTAGVVANAIPSGPGGIGVYELGIVWAYSLLGVDPESALAIALVMHVFQLIIPSILGVIGIYVLGDNIFGFISGARSTRKKYQELQ